MMYAPGKATFDGDHAHNSHFNFLTLCGTLQLQTHCNSYPMGYIMHTVAETPTFSRQASKLFDEMRKRELINFLRRIRKPVTKS